MHISENKDAQKKKKTFQNYTKMQLKRKTQTQKKKKTKTYLHASAL